MARGDNEPPRSRFAGTAQARSKAGLTWWQVQDSNLCRRKPTDLQKVAPETVPAKVPVYQADYIQYLELAEEWASDPRWQQAPDVAEFALFDQ